MRGEDGKPPFLKGKGDEDEEGDGKPPFLKGGEDEGDESDDEEDGKPPFLKGKSGEDKKPPFLKGKGDEDETPEFMGKCCGDTKKSAKFMSSEPAPVYQKKFMGKDGKKYMAKVFQTEDTISDADFFASLIGQARGTVHQKWSSGLPMKTEDALIQPNDPNASFKQSEPSQPSPGQVGYAPQGRVGDIPRVSFKEWREARIKRDAQEKRKR